MQFLTDSHIGFMKYRRVFVWVSISLLAVAGFELFYGGLNLGVDFAGGTQLTVAFRERPEIDGLRRILEEAGFREAQIQRFGGETANEVLVKTPAVGETEEGVSGPLIEALDEALNPDLQQSFDLNQRGSEALTALLAEEDPDGLGGTGLLDEEVREHYGEVADAIVAVRTDNKLIASWEQIAAVEEVSEATLETLERRAALWVFNVLSTENVGPQIGSELRIKGTLAVVFALVGMLAYIWFRFELRFGIGAVVASFHDVIITLGLFAMLGYEFNLSTIAAFLTLVGYSVNDTVVIFDRVRENMRKVRRRDLAETMDVSLNQTLSRTLLTSGTTLLAVGCLFALGGEVIRGFSFVLLVGVVIGTYSSLYVACPFVLVWDRLAGRETKTARTRSSARQSRAA